MARTKRVEEPRLVTDAQAMKGNISSLHGRSHSEDGGGTRRSIRQDHDTGVEDNLRR
jgi:hypothetical protein